jgi:hypothetical protein
MHARIYWAKIQNPYSNVFSQRLQSLDVMRIVYQRISFLSLVVGLLSCWEYTAVWAKGLKKFLRFSRGTV